ncbi:AAA family ATPase [Alkalihalobacillus sp. CinArs1]|uniref:AAA family ATPase n=1 Tax=Alkalihalobacillus sp. CinArs1 TaxID=2995314 RepID=UPI0022DE2F84|nr:AAA family ATPase [Alkalihalobacillus sp. CinArs1]
MVELKEQENKLSYTREKVEEIRTELGKFIVGQEKTIEQVLWTIFSGGHALLEGLPGLGKTMLVRTLSDIMDLDFSRIQYTPDLMPGDITGTMMIQPDEKGGQSFSFHKGPIFSNIVLADEINRATPKTQSSLLEAMQEKTVTVMGEMKKLPRPFFVLATQNPIELEGTYPLPEAQMDRFLIKIDVEYPSRNELKEIAVRTTGGNDVKLEKVVDGQFIVDVQNLTNDVLVTDSIMDFAVSLVLNTHPDQEGAPEAVQQYVRYGSGPRGLQGIIKVAKTRALLAGRANVSIGDIKQVAIPVLRHRVFLNFEGEASGVVTDDLLMEVIKGLEER